MNRKAIPCYFQMKLEWPYKYQIKCISDQRILSETESNFMMINSQRGH